MLTKETEDLLRFFKHSMIKEFKTLDWYFCPNPNQLQLFDTTKYTKYDQFH